MKSALETLQRLPVRAVFAATLLSALAGSAAGQGRGALAVVAKPAGQQFTPVPATLALNARMEPHARPVFRAANASGSIHLGPLSMEKQRTAFLNQIRLPLASFWNGRVQVVCLHQRVRPVHTHTAVVVPDAASSLRVQSAGTIPGRNAASWSGGIWLQIRGPRT